MVVFFPFFIALYLQNLRSFFKQSLNKTKNNKTKTKMYLFYEQFLCANFYIKINIFSESFAKTENDGFNIFPFSLSNNYFKRGDL